MQNFLSLGFLFLLSTLLLNCGNKDETPPPAGPGPSGGVQPGPQPQGMSSFLEDPNPGTPWRTMDYNAQATAMRTLGQVFVGSGQLVWQSGQHVMYSYGYDYGSAYPYGGSYIKLLQRFNPTPIQSFQQRTSRISGSGGYFGHYSRPTFSLGYENFQFVEEITYSDASGRRIESTDTVALFQSSSGKIAKVAYRSSPSSVPLHLFTISLQQSYAQQQNPFPNQTYYSETHHGGVDPNSYYDPYNFPHQQYQDPFHSDPYGGGSYGGWFEGIGFHTPGHGPDYSQPTQGGFGGAIGNLQILQESATASFYQYQTQPR